MLGQTYIVLTHALPHSHIASMAESSVSVLSESAKFISQPSVLHRMLFAKSLLPDNTPKLWEIIAKFAAYIASSIPPLLPQQAKLIIENITFTDEQSLVSDDALLKELVFMPFEGRSHLGMILVSNL